MTALKLEADLKTVATIIQNPSPHWVGDGFHVGNYFPSHLRGLSAVSPFLLLDYQKPEAYPPTTNPRRGVGPHPHRGFETVTLALDGAVAHHDSKGNGGVIHPGDVQWMTAGAGILHREYHEKAFANRGGTLHMVQLWVNLPRADKMTAPRYQHLEAKNIAQVAISNATVRVIAGTYESAKGPAKTFSPVTLLDILMQPGSRVPLSIPAEDNAAILVTAGKVTLNRTLEASHGDLAVFAHHGTQIEAETQTPARILVLSGTPIREPIVHHGPFVMNTRQEILQAMEDFDAGKFGHLDD